MTCKFCLAEIEDGVTVCPLCGKNLAEETPAEETPAEETPVEETVQQEEEAAEELLEEPEFEALFQKPKKPKKPKKTKKKLGRGWKIALAVTGVVVLAVILAGAILYFMGYGKEIAHNLKFWRDNDISYKLSYTVDDAGAEKKADTVVATLGNQTLTNGELQAYYWMSVYEFLDYYGSYLSMIGVDVSVPLSDQIYDEETGMTYQQMFLSNALQDWRTYATLVQLAEDANFTLDDTQQAYLTEVEEELKTMATERNYADVETFIDKELFPGSSLEKYMQYVKVNHVGLCYYDTLYADLLPDEQEIEAYYTAHEAEFEENGMAKDAGNYYDVRHILIEVEGGTEDEDGVMTYTDAEWEACRESAQKLLDEFLANDPTEEKFADLAVEYSQDSGSASNGGLYTQLTAGYGFIANFENWYVDESRQVGDTGLVKNTESSVQGYHIMYFSGSQPIWRYEVQSAILSEGTTAMMDEARAKFPMEVNYKNIVLGEVNLAG